MAAYSRPRFFVMRVTPHGGFEQRPEPPQVLVHARTRVRPEELDHGAPGAARWGVVAAAEVDPRAAPLAGEPDGPGILQHRARFAAPGQQPILVPLGPHHVPL